MVHVRGTTTTHLELDAYHGEGAYWDAQDGVVRFVDMLAGDVLTRGERLVRRDHVGDVAAVIRRRRAGGFVVAVERGFALVDDDLRVGTVIEAFEGEGIRMNEGACDSRGRLFCGSMAYDGRTGAGTMYRLDPDLTVHVVREGVTIPNGLVWTDEGTTALHVETAEDAVFAYDYDPDTGEWGERRVFLDLAPFEGSPDGMARDEEGGLWIAMWQGSAVLRFDAAGELTDRVELPVSRVTSCAFGGPDGKTLFITTSRQDAENPEPDAGRLFSVPVGIGGAPVHHFAG